MLDPRETNEGAPEEELDPETGEPDGGGRFSKTATIIEHLEELRRRIIWCLVVLLVLSGISFTFIEQVRAILLDPAGGLQLIYTSPPEALMASIRLAIMSGLVLSMPVFLYHLLAFILPGLYKKEARVLVPIMLVMLAMFAAGISFGYLVAFPFAIRFFLRFATDDLVPMFTITEYLGFVTRFLFTFGLVFQLPLLMMFLGMLGVVRPPFLRKYRKYVILGIVVGSAIITPPDVISQIMIGVPLWGLYEVGILLVSVVQRRRRKREREEEEEEGM